MAISIRPAVLADALSIHELHVATATVVFNQFFGGKGLAEWLVTRNAEVCAREIEQWSFVVAENQGVMIGFGALNVAKARIEDVYVASDKWKQGCGSEIVRSLEALALEAGLQKITLQATGPAILFYRKCGYSTETDEPNPSWALMEKKLS
ncbi:MAG: GNAT family N-acetyltransferase [Gammaproteobacteria bacterium]|nr:GNAT family N-acetyltransferase [Gammaproteobacteria bacterium]